MITELEQLPIFLRIRHFKSKSATLARGNGHVKVRLSSLTLPAQKGILSHLIPPGFLPKPLTFCRMYCQRPPRRLFLLLFYVGSRFRCALSKRERGRR